MNTTEMIIEQIKSINENLNFIDKSFSEETKSNLCFKKGILTDIRDGVYMFFELTRFVGSIKNQKVSDNPHEKQLFIRMDELLSVLEKKILLNQEEECEKYPNYTEVKVKNIEAKQLLMEKIDVIDCSTLGSYIEAGEISRQLIGISMMNDPDSKEILEFIATFPTDQFEDDSIGNATLPEILKFDCLATITKFDIYF